MPRFSVVKTVVMRAKRALASASPVELPVIAGRLPSWVRIIGVKALKSYPAQQQLFAAFHVKQGGVAADTAAVMQTIRSLPATTLQARQRPDHYRSSQRPWYHLPTSWWEYFLTAGVTQNA